MLLLLTCILYFFQHFDSAHTHTHTHTRAHLLNLLNFESVGGLLEAEAAAAAAAAAATRARQSE
jgi:hypothetical protein